MRELTTNELNDVAGGRSLIPAPRPMTPSGPLICPVPTSGGTTSPIQSWNGIIECGFGGTGTIESGNGIIGCGFGAMMV